MRREGQFLGVVNDVRKFQRTRRSRAGQIDQRGGGETGFDLPAQCGDGGIRAVDLAVVADVLDLLQVVGVFQGGLGDVAQRQAVLFDRSLELIEAQEFVLGGRPALRGGRLAFPLADAGQRGFRAAR